MADYQQILARHSQVQYPPEVQEKLARSRQKLQAQLAEIRTRQQGQDTHTSNHGGS